MTREERDAIRARCERATLGEWVGEAYDNGQIKLYSHGIIAKETALRGINNILFICRSREDIPALLDALDEADEVIAENERWNNTDCNACPISGWSACEVICASKASLIDWLSTIATDCDRWRDRAKALYQAISPGCSSCKHPGENSHEYPCSSCYRGNACSTIDKYEFDEERFFESEEQ